MNIDWNVPNRTPVRMQSNQANSASAMKGLGKLVGSILGSGDGDADIDIDSDTDVAEQDSLWGDTPSSVWGDEQPSNTGLNITPVESDVNSKNEDESGKKTGNAVKAVSAVAKIISML